jgi:hypothetical protein
VLRPTLDDVAAVRIQVGNDRLNVGLGDLGLFERSPEQSDHLVECRIVDLQMGVRLAQRGSAVARRPPITDEMNLAWWSTSRRMSTSAKNGAMVAEVSTRS